MPEITAIADLGVAPAPGCELAVGVVPVMAPPVPADLAQRLRAVADWFATVSEGQCRLSFPILPTVLPAQPIRYFSAAGGQGPPPQNSQTLVRAVLDQLAPASLASLVAAQGRLLVVVNGPIQPHSWHLLGGGKWLGPTVWCHSYAIVPVAAPLGTLAHELGHLLFQWPDLSWATALAPECLMARGALGTQSQAPAPPCGPLRVRAGWQQPRTLQPTDRVSQLQPSNLGHFLWQQREWLIEYRSQPQPRLLLYRYPTHSLGGQPRLQARLFLTEDDHHQSVLGLIAPYLRRSPPGNTEDLRCNTLHH